MCSEPQDFHTNNAPDVTSSSLFYDFTSANDDSDLNSSTHNEFTNNSVNTITYKSACLISNESECELESDSNSYSHDEDENEDLDTSSISNESINCSEKFDQELNDIIELRRWVIDSQIPRVHVTSLLKILRRRAFPSLPACSQTFLNTAKAKYQIQHMMGAKNEMGEFVYLGTEAGLQACINLSLHETNILE